MWLGPETDERLREFYKRTRPPGFWGPIAAASGTSAADRVRLKRGLVAMLVAAFSLFSLLTGFGSLIAGSPPPAWLPWRVVWIPLVLVVGAGLVPVWWKLAFEDED